MRNFVLGLILIVSVQSAFSQQTQIKGQVIDTLEKKKLQYAVIALLRKADSTLFKFTRTDHNGAFHIKNVVPGKYILLITYPTFADFSDIVEIKDQPENDLGQVPLTLKARLLDAVIIRNAGAIRIKGDTTEYIADSFVVKEGATVEDLLKRLPGFQVNSKGEVTTQGQRVQKVLVDGEEFFGDDPTMATQNIAARSVDKVQVYDTKTEQQNMKGISTGTEGKTVNIKLKEDAKKGTFGKAHIGSDFIRLMDAKVLYNRFKGSKKFSAYGTKSDISTGSLNWEDRRKLSIEDDYEYDEISGVYYGFGSQDDFGAWGLRGLPNSYTAGVLYNNKWNESINNITSSYRYNRLATVNDAYTLTQNVLSTGITYRNKFHKTKGLNQQHSGSGKYEWKIDSLTSIKLTTVATYKKNDLFSNMNNEFLDASRAFINKGVQVNIGHTARLQVDNVLTYKQLFKKKNRIMIATVRYGIINDDQDNMVKTTTNFFKDGIIDSIDIGDQMKIVNGTSRTLGTKISWSEPFGLKWALVGEVGLNKNNSISHRNTFDKDNSGKYAVLNQEFSNNFDLIAISKNALAIFKYTDQKIRAAFGSGVATVNLRLLDMDRTVKNNYDFLNLTPQASIAYTYKPQSRIFFNYRGTTRQPTIDQLQPIRDNTDRLNIFIGNPNLKVGFNHSLNVGFNSFKMLSQKGIFSNFSFNIPVNAITFYNSLDVSRGKQTYMPVNVNGNRYYSMYVSLFKQSGEKKLGYEFNSNVNGGRNTNFINGEKNRTTFYSSNFGFGVNYRKPDKYYINIIPSAGYNVSKSSLNKKYNSNYWNYGGKIEGNIMLPGKLELNSDINFDLRQHLSAFPTNPNQVNWNASLSRTYFKDKSGKIYLVANDILDQNKGFRRNISSNFISEERYSRLSRYFLLKLEWSFNKTGQKASK